MAAVARAGALAGLGTARRAPSPALGSRALQPRLRGATRTVLAPCAQSTGRAGSASFQEGGAQASFGRRATAGTPAERPAVVAAASAAGDAPSAAAAAPAAAVPAKKASKPRLPALDSLRFFLIAYIGVGHFVAFATKDALLLKLFTQVSRQQTCNPAAVLEQFRPHTVTSSLLQPHCHVASRTQSSRCDGRTACPPPAPAVPAAPGQRVGGRLLCHLRLRGWLHRHRGGPQGLLSSCGHTTQ